MDTDIAEALKTQLGSALPALALPCAWPNVEFKRPNGKNGVLPYLACSHMPAGRRALTLDVGPTAGDARTGIFQVSVFWPKGEGETLAGEVADKIVSLFERGTILRYGATRVIVGASYVSKGVPDDVYWSVPVTVPWSNYT